MNTPTPAPRRWKLWFSMRTLLVFVLVLSLPLGWLSFALRRAQVQRQAVEKIRDRGGTAMYCGQLVPQDERPSRCPAWLQDALGDDFFRAINYVSLRENANDHDLMHLKPLSELRALHVPGNGITYDGLVHLGAFPHLQALVLTETTITDRGLDHVVKLSELNFLTVHSAEITDEGLAKLCKMPQLETLNLSNTRISDAGMSHLRSLARLSTLRLKGLPITDAGLGALPDLPALEWLEIANSSITDAGLMHLAKAPRLRHLVLGDTLVTDAGVAALRQAHPKLEIVR